MCIMSATYLKLRQSVKFVMYLCSCKSKYFAIKSGVILDLAVLFRYNRGVNGERES